MKNKNLLILLVPFLLWFLDEIFLFRPTFFFVSLGLGVLIISLAVRALLKSNRSQFWPIFIITPSLFYLSFSFYSTILVNQLWMQIIFLLNAWFIFSYLRNTYYYFSFGAPEREIKLRRLLTSGAFLSTFALAASLYGLPIFLSWPFVLLWLVFITLSFILFGQFFMLTSRIEREQKIFLGINVLVLSELAGILYFLPLNYNILALVVAIIFFVLLLINRWRETNRLNWKNLRFPFVIGSIIMIFIFLSSRWL